MLEGQEHILNNMAGNLMILAIALFVFLGVTAVILRFIPIFKEIKDFIMGIVTLVVIYVWFKITF